MEQGAKSKHLEHPPRRSRCYASGCENTQSLPIGERSGGDDDGRSLPECAIKVISYFMAERIYLDWNATTPLRPDARQAMAAAWDLPGNPSSVHAEGRQARRLVEDARAAVAAALGGPPRNVVFTSGG